MGGLSVIILMFLLFAFLIALAVLAGILIVATLAGVGGGISLIFAGNKLAEKGNHPNATLFCRLASVTFLIVGATALLLLIVGIAVLFF
ncbi:hypothetical protein [Butyrivibrio proteoclasticus]|uniref:hypothetical protein n=1 Tax=Butyrivibrio proteoclasticus TaxID=43305 RepID=UPI000478BFC8|nr:hypothetical protein [Butyrivibrio proteoclasticus]